MILQRPAYQVNQRVLTLRILYRLKWLPRNCHGDEVSRFETHLLLGILLTTCLLCACIVSCCRQMRKGQGGGAGMPLVAHAQPVDAVVVEASFVAAPT